MEQLGQAERNHAERQVNKTNIEIEIYLNF